MTDRRVRRLRPPGRMVGWLAFVAAVFLLGVYVPSAIQQDQGLLYSPAFALESAAAGPVLRQRLLEVEVVSLRPGQHVADAFLQNGVDAAEAGGAIRVLADVVDIRRVRPADTFYLFRSPQGHLERVEYEEARAESRVILERDGDGYTAAVEAKQVDRYLTKITGTVEDNLFFSMQRAGGNAALVVNFADLFAWDFDFFTETRAGDAFEILVEEKVVEGTPAGFGRIVAGRYHPAGADHTLEAFRFAWDNGEESGFYTRDGRSVRKFFLKSPLNFRRISSHYTNRRYHPIHKVYRPHLGVDYAAATGTPVVALGNGRVVFRGWKGGYGRTVQIKHNRTYLTQYAHLSRYGVKQGTRIKQGQVIGYVGSTGVSTGPHLDFRVMENGRWINPLHLKGGQSEPLPEEHRESYAVTIERIDGVMNRLESGESVRISEDAARDPTLALARLDTPSAS